MAMNKPAENTEKNNLRNLYHDRVCGIANNFDEPAISFQKICNRLQSAEPKIMELIKNNVDPFEKVINITRAQKDTMTADRAATLCLMEIYTLFKAIEEENRKADFADVIYEETRRGAMNAIRIPGFGHTSSGIVKTPGLDIYDVTNDEKMVPWVTMFGSHDEVNKDYRHAMNVQSIAADDRDSMTGQAVDIRNKGQWYDEPHNKKP
jgi:hypothetical protein